MIVREGSITDEETVGSENARARHPRTVEADRGPCHFVPEVTELHDLLERRRDLAKRFARIGEPCIEERFATIHRERRESRAVETKRWQVLAHLQPLFQLLASWHRSPHLLVDLLRDAERVPFGKRAACGA